MSNFRARLGAWARAAAAAAAAARAHWRPVGADDVFFWGQYPRVPLRCTLG